MIEIDLDKLEERNPKYCYTEEEAIARYGPKEGQEFGEKVQICGVKLPKILAMKYLKCGVCCPHSCCTWTSQMTAAIGIQLVVSEPMFLTASDTTCLRFSRESTGINRYPVRSWYSS